MNSEATFRALADANRRKLLDSLYACDGQTLGMLCKLLDMTRPAVAKHLRILENANLVSVHWQGREKQHYLNPVPIHEISERWIRKFDRKPLSTLAELKKRLEGDHG